MGGIKSRSRNRLMITKELQTLYEQTKGSDALGKFRERAWNHFLSLGFPSRKDENFRHIDLHRLCSQSYHSATISSITQQEINSYIYPECRESVLVFVNGHYDASLSNTRALGNNVAVMPLESAFSAYGTFLNNRLIKTLKTENDPFVILNKALHGNSGFIYVSPRTAVNAPIHILHVISSNDSYAVMPQLHLFVGQQSKLSLTSSVAMLSGTQHWMNQVTDIVIDEDATVEYLPMAWCIPHQCCYFDGLRAHLKNHSTFNCTEVNDGCRTMRHHYHIELAGENAKCLMSGLSLLEGGMEAHTNIRIDHQAPACTSRQLYKKVLGTGCLSSFQGKILVQRHAQGTDALQTNNNLLLNDQAEAHSKPFLEIFADNVKASHGATVSQLNADELFYLMARGFSPAQAKSMLIKGFCKEVIDLISLSPIRHDLISKIETSKGMNSNANNRLFKVTP